MTLTLRELPQGGGVDVRVETDQGRLRGFFGNVFDEALVSGLSVEAAPGVVLKSEFLSN